MAYWKFDDAGEFDDAGRALPHLSARDSSGQGNDLPLVVMPQPRATTIQQVRLLTPWCTLSCGIMAQGSCLHGPLEDMGYIIPPRRSSHVLSMLLVSRMR